MKRYVSLDFLRGLSIFMMLILHMISDYLNLEPLLASINDVPSINLVALIVLPYLGGLAGFFLLISATANMVSMQKQLQKGMSPNTLIKRQVFGGLILLIFAMLTESTIGYHGAFGNLFDHLNNPANTEWNRILWRFNTFETLHTIAWCVIINGLVQGLISRKDKWKDWKYQVKIYIILAVLIVILTQPIWDLVNLAFPGYPFGMNPNTGTPRFQPWIGKDPFWYILISPFLAALAAPVEPLFPYLAVSFVGSILGIYLSRPREEIPRDFPRKVILWGFLFFVIGSIGVIIVIISVMESQGFEAAANLYRLISFHRHWAPDFPDIQVPPFAWVWQFTSLNGFGTMAAGLMLKLVEFRGKAEEFAKKTTLIRRFGFIAFTCYAFQWIYRGTFFFVTWIVTGVPYQRIDWGYVWIGILLVLTIYTLIMKLWEKVGYIGSIEWAIGTLAKKLVPGKKISTTKSDGESSRPIKWYNLGRLDVEGAFYNAEWLNIVKPEEIDHKSLQESKLAYKLSLIALITIIFMPISFVSFGIAQNSLKTEKINEYNKKARILSLIGMILVILFFGLTGNLSLSALGFAL